MAFCQLMNFETSFPSCVGLIALKLDYGVVRKWVLFCSIFQFYSRMKRQSWMWLRQVLFCPAVTDWLLGLSVIRPPPAEAENLQREKADVMGTPAGFPASVSLLASISPRLPRHLSPESVIAFSFICIYFPLPSPSTPSPPSLHPCLPCIPALPNQRRDSSRAQQTLPQVLVYLTYSNVLSLEWHCWAGMYRQQTLCLHSLFLLDIDVSTIPEQQKYCRSFVIALQRDKLLLRKSMFFHSPPLF